MNRRSFCVNSGVLAGSAVLRGLPALARPAGEGQFQLGCVTYNLLQGMDLETVIKTLETVGLAAVELRTTHKHGVEPSLGQEERVKVRERFAKSKVRLLSYGTTCEFQSPDAAERKKQVESGKSFVDLAKDTGALAVKVRPNGFPTGVARETTIQTIAAGLRELAEYGQTKGIEIWMEVHGSGTQEADVSAAILKAAGHKNVGACWNSNPTDVKGGSVKQSFELLQPYLRSAHINELSSSYPWRELFKLMRESGYQRYTLAEVAESKEPERFLGYYKALWTELQR
jgi:sugar phosphate isomerase/epimerase